jgi:DNA-3-methyladenine glycosylase
VSFFQRPAEEVARDLLGTIVVSTIGGVETAGRIVETEAYLGVDDPASHGYLGRRHARNEALFGPPGSWYVYLSYGMHWCANLVCEPRGQGHAVLLRALEPIAGLDVMRKRRGGVPDRLLCAGPGRLTQALGMSAAQDGEPMRTSEVRVYRGTPVEDAVVEAGPRVGITKAVEHPLRFWERGSPWISRGPVRVGPKSE